MYIYLYIYISFASRAASSACLSSSPRANSPCKAAVFQKVKTLGKRAPAPLASFPYSFGQRFIQLLTKAD